MTSISVLKLPERSLSRVIAETFGVSCSSEVFKYIFSTSICYLTGACSAFEFQHCVKPYITTKSFSAKDFRLRFHKDQYFCLILKMFVFQIGTYRSIDKKKFAAIADEIGVAECDFPRILKIWSEFSELRAHVKSVVKSIPADMRYLLEVTNIEKYFNGIHARIFKYIKFRTYNKLRFVIKSSNYEPSDLHSEIFLKVVQAFYHLLPLRLSEVHTVNYLKRAANNCALNIIESETTQKRGRLVNTGLDSSSSRTFSLLVVSENQMALNPEGKDTSYENLFCDDGHINKFELEFSVSEVLSRYKKLTKKYRLLCILMGAEDTEFTAFLKARKLCVDGEDNHDVQLRTTVQKFNKLLSEFLHVREDKMNVFMLRVAKSLAIPITNDLELRHG